MSYTEKHENISKDDWMARLESRHIARADMNKLIMNYLVTEGFKEAAEKFQQESGVAPSMELDSMDERIRIRDAIQSGRIQEATALVNQLHPELLDNDRYLYFHLQVASELNAAILKMENRDPTTPKLASLLKLIFWSQEELDKKKIKYPKMTDLAGAVIESPK
ncbi:uncharacterized protein GBIM_18890 [Gryllus bimaculatus]|nr:uncharacterized protein GBIM_18890 [Gryllus bimaculatus]